MSNLIEKIQKIEDKPEQGLEELLPDYFENRREDLAKLKVYHQSGDIQGIAAVAHKILGTAKSYGLDRLDVIVNELEQNSKINPDLSQSGEIINVFEQYLSEQNY